jgi:DNA-directed RNA polymerase specialized sigma24 family protein
MKDDQIKKLREIPRKTWENAIAKCHEHIRLKLLGKTKSGAHSDQRLSMPAKDFYMKSAITALYQGKWEWKDDKYLIDEQLIRIINSMISEQVRKYKVELSHGNKTILVKEEQLTLHLENEITDEYDEEYLEKLSKALTMACENNPKYQMLISLKRQDLSYSDICKQMGCTKNEAYQMMENVSKRANKILKSL